MKKNLLEWTVFGTSCLLILALVGYLVVKSFTYKETPPNLAVTIGQEQPATQSQHIYRLELVNQGTQAAENVKVEVLLKQDGKIIEETETLFPLAPHESIMKAWVTFKTTRQNGQTTEVHVVGYNQP